MRPDPATAACECCPLGGPPRRDFLRHAAAAALLALLPIDVRRVALVSGTGTRADKSYPFPSADGVSIDKDEAVIVARFAGRVFAFSLACPHQNTAIRWDDGNGRFQCPKHKSRYRPDGTFIEGRATRGLDRFAVRREGDRLLVNLDALYREDTDAGPWATAFVTVEK